MGWKDWFGRKVPETPPAAQKDELDIPWIPADANPWGVPVLDVRPVTLSMLATSKDPQCAANAVSFGSEDGRCFADAEPAPFDYPLDLIYRVDRMLAEGPLYLPTEMEHKWALFYYDGRILFVRSWTREVMAAADVVARNGCVDLTQLHGGLPYVEHKTGVTREVWQEFVSRSVDYLIRTHVLDEVWPVPLDPSSAIDPRVAALWCMSVYGNKALYAVPHSTPPKPSTLPEAPERPLRSYSLLHLSVARRDEAGVRAQLAAGVPPDLLAADGLSPLHWAVVSDDTTMFDLLLSAGCPVDVRSEEGATPLMQAVQSNSLTLLRYLLERGADPNAGDSRGFTALHRAAEMGLEDIVRALLAAGADPLADAQGHTPLSFAESRGHTSVVAMLRG